jgi:hypothetical protein
LGDLARQTRQNAGKSKVVVTNETLEHAYTGPIPEIRTDGSDNSDEIVKAIDTFRISHTPEQTEQALRTWFERHDSAMVRLFELNRGIDDRQMQSYYTPSRTGDPNSNQRQLEENRRSALFDNRQRSENSQTLSRLQQALYSVRSKIAEFRMKYEWFKIRTSSGGTSY